MTSEERREARYQRRKAKRDEARLRRSKECGDFDEVFSFRHLYLSGKKCCKGVYWKNSTQRYIGNIKAYERYMDDGVAISPDIDDLYLCMDGLKIICEKCGLELNLKKTRVIPLRDYYRWLKTRFIITPTGKVVRKMNKDSTKIVRHKLRAFRGKLDRGEMTLADIRCSVDSYNGHMKRGHSFKVRQRTNQYFKSLYGFYPDEKGWKSHV